jgi:hypothetical protein
MPTAYDKIVAAHAEAAAADAARRTANRDRHLAVIVERYEAAAKKETTTVGFDYDTDLRVEKIVLPKRFQDLLEADEVRLGDLRDAIDNDEIGELRFTLTGVDEQMFAFTFSVDNDADIDWYDLTNLPVSAQMHSANSHWSAGDTSTRIRKLTDITL